MSRILHLVNLSQRYRGSKGSPGRRQEDGVIGNLAAPCHLEESASHHNDDFLPEASHLKPSTEREERGCEALSFTNMIP